MAQGCRRRGTPHRSVTTRAAGPATLPRHRPWLHHASHLLSCLAGSPLTLGPQLGTAFVAPRHRVLRCNALEAYDEHQIICLMISLSSLAPAISRIGGHAMVPGSAQPKVVRGVAVLRRSNL